MGEEQKEVGGGKGDQGKEKKAAGGGGGGKGEQKKDGVGDGKKEEGVVEVKVDVHCEGCARKIRRAVNGLDGVERVRVDPTNSKMKVVGNIDPWKLKEFLEANTKKKVEFVSPKDPPKKKTQEPAAGDAKKAAAAAAVADKKEEKSDNKPKPPPVITEVLKARLHCQGCIYRLKKAAYKFKGVEEVAVDAGKDLVTVKGTMDVKSLVSYLNDRFKGAGVEIHRSVKKGEGKEDKREKGGDGGGGEKEEKEKGGEKKKDGGGEQKEAAAAPATVAEVNKFEYYGYGGGYGYRVEMIHPPQLFSDENPNACAVM